MSAPTSMAEKVELGRAALAKFDAASDTCPFHQRRTPPTDDPCPKCKATARESCRVEVSAAYALVIEMRSALS